MGWAENAESVLKAAKVGLAPLRFGAGIKGKLIDAMKTGTPTVTTSIGAEGMHGEYPWSGGIANTAKALSDLAVGLYQSRKEWESAQRNAIDIVNTIYDKKFLGQKLAETILKIQSNQQKHRNRNFIGRMLMHHTMTSNRYMGKWIEEKNRKS